VIGVGAQVVQSQLLMTTGFNDYLATDYRALRSYLGEVRFNALAAECLAAHPAQSFNVRDYSATLPEDLVTFQMAHAELSELATLERALRMAFEASDVKTEATAQNQWKLHDSVSLLSFAQNTVSIWSSLKCGEPPPRPYKLDTPQHVLVWRCFGQPRMRILGEEEYLPLATLRDRITVVGDDEPYLRGWLDTEVLVETPSGCAEK
jgi:Putative DNA-binding domain